MLVDRFKDILRSAINDQIANNPMFQDLMDKDFEKEWKKYYEEIINNNKTQQNYSYQDYDSQQSYQQGNYQQQKKAEPSLEEKHYNALEVPKGSDFATIKKAYRKMIKVYHPDLFQGDPKKQEMAQKVTLEINEAYNYFEKKLK
ncbi:DnaJ domain-containing protein [Flammeovirga yaeyamensis]|uniref:DnaJ domain-containing protein n=1 Tax=Flammeovirga yaeyamensis TaxID=367791 RepID=A0AAX1N7H6_9BACT|nr:J domain-containing protein [Flammeovirga yaeyamensis]MBB3697781.1 DnaJ-domain-containing protein 1 [Flammeovirga yaeyamensis]NMF35863.1 J domain-containing protein [Flammeovirga yaeyamensis]QWG03186.1 DnaJ domain-containing protein [Flammeovirga yaeyamensis]